MQQTNWNLVSDDASNYFSYKHEYLSHSLCHNSLNSIVRKTGHLVDPLLLAETLDAAHTKPFLSRKRCLQVFAQQAVAYTVDLHLTMDVILVIIKSALSHDSQSQIQERTQDKYGGVNTWRYGRPAVK